MMDGIMILGLAMVLYGVATLLVAFLKPQFVWKTSKLQGFVQILGETGTVVFLAAVGVAVLGGGVWVLLA